jgi:hypothetical protein
MIALNLLPLFFLLLAKSFADKIQYRLNPLSMSTPEFPIDLKKVGIALGIVVSIYTIASGWVTINKDVQKNSTRIENLELQGEKTDKKLDKIMDKLDVIQDKLSNKQDRRR